MIPFLRFFAISAAIALFLGMVASIGARPARAQMQCHVVEVHDADSIRCQDGTRLRLWGIDAPELDQPFGQEAAAEVRDVLLGEDLECHHMGFDRYYRILARCDHAGYDVGEWIVGAGLAWCFERYSRAYCDTQAIAKRDRQGLWGAKHNPTPPWEFRAQKRNGK